MDEFNRALKKLELLSAAPYASLEHFKLSAFIPIDIHTLSKVASYQAYQAYIDNIK